MSVLAIVIANNKSINSKDKVFELVVLAQETDQSVSDYKNYILFKIRKEVPKTKHLHINHIMIIKNGGHGGGRFDFAPHLLYYWSVSNKDFSVF